MARALRGDVDLVVHGGDVFHRSRVAPSLVHQAFHAMRWVADRGIPVFVVPGNHERSRIPHRRFAAHSGIHVFDHPRTFRVAIQAQQVAVTGFPYARNDVRGRFSELVRAAELGAADADVRLLCIHHCVEGATVGPGDFTFRGSDDVVRARDIPDGIAAVLSGHIHRHQVLTHDLAGRPVPAPVFYPGSVERTSIAEIDELKGYVVIDIQPGPSGGDVVDWAFEPLPARPMVVRDLRLDDVASPAQLAGWLEETIARVSPNAVLRIRVQGVARAELRAVLTAKRVREVAPASMNVELVALDSEGRRWQSADADKADQMSAEQISLAL